MSAEPAAASRWFSRVVWLGIAANLALALPTLLMPARMLAFSGLPITEPLLWTQFAALLLILLSAFYVPAALDPQRYRLVAWLAVAARLAGVVFFVLFQPSEYHMFGYFDLVFFVPEAALLAAMGTNHAASAAREAV
ncbi:MAG: hypothetical protein QM736_05140 [Vicinamibacterales bacterium]